MASCWAFIFFSWQRLYSIHVQVFSLDYFLLPYWPFMVAMTTSFPLQAMRRRCPASRWRSFCCSSASWTKPKNPVWSNTTRVCSASTQSSRWAKVASPCCMKPEGHIVKIWKYSGNTVKKQGNYSIRRSLFQKYQYLLQKNKKTIVTD